MGNTTGIIQPSWRETCSNCGVVNVLVNYAYCDREGCLVLHHQMEQKCTNCNKILVEGL